MASDTPGEVATGASGPATERAGDALSGVSLAELLASFSLATDLGMGQPVEHMLRSWVIASRLGERLGLSEDDRVRLFYVAMLAWVGCVADTPEVNRWFGDDIAFREDSYDIEFAGVSGMRFMLGHVGAGSPALQRLRLGATLVGTGARGVQQGLLSHCLTTSAMARRLGLDEAVSDSLQQFFTRWDGRGVPSGVGGADVAFTVRLFQLADVAEVHYRTKGLDAAVAVARERAGRQFDPAVATAFCDAAGDILDDSAEGMDAVELITHDPRLRQPMTEDQLDDALLVVADFTDLRSPYRAGHSRAVSRLAADAARLSGLSNDDVRLVRRAGLVHDIGLHAVPGVVLDSAQKLTSTEQERVRMHSYYTERMLARPAPLARIGAIASLTCERLDGTGHHRGLTGSAIPRTARVLAAADTFQAMTEDRSYRKAWSSAEAAAELGAQVRAGRLDNDAVACVLAAAGQTRAGRASGPDGLTPREIEVLVLIARGGTTRQVATQLGIGVKTAGTHIERIYAKTGASTRSTATLYAVQHGLVGPP